MGDLISLSEYARRRGCSLKAVQKAIASGRIKIVQDTDGSVKIDQVQADLDWDKFTQHSKRHSKRKIEINSIDLPMESRAEDEELKNDASFMEARRVREIYAAKLSKLAYDIDTKKLLRADEVAAKLYQAVRASRDAMLNIPNRISNELAALSDPMKVAEIITREIHQALEELSRVAV